MKITVVGAGAMGSLLAARLTLAMRSHASEPGAAPELERVLLYGRSSDHLDAIRDHGLELTERDGQVTRTRLDVTSDPAEVKGSDVVVVLVKAWATEEAVAPLRDYVSRDTIALTLQNGLGNASALRRALMKNGARPHVWLGVTTQAAVRTEPGKVTHTTDGITAIGRRTPLVNDALSGLAAAFTDNGWRTVAVADIHRWVWRKLAINCAINPLTALAGVPNHAMSTDQDLRLAAMEVIEEVVEVAASQGVRLNADVLGDLLEGVARSAGNPYSSMYVDLEQGLRTEIDAINGQVVRHAKRANIPVPANTLLTRLVRAHERGHRPASGSKEGPLYTPRADVHGQA
ncbi:MAG TPA: ketopantoate reductase family protein [Thermomicrobiales bacterium]|nr:ketopantoate reductase family protein [Thermomicrobiales bacterium]